MAAARASLVAAEVDVTHRGGLSDALHTWQRTVDGAERRIRTGVPLSAEALLVDFERLSDEAAREAAREAAPSRRGPPPAATLSVARRTLLDAALRPGGQPRSALLRAVDASRALGAGPLAELAPALLLAAAGLTERLRILPFAEAEPAQRERALAAAEDDGGEAFAHLLLAECAESARARRLAVRRQLRDVAADDDLLAPLGRAAITARRALSVLRQDLATSIPSLAVALDCSRPAAGDALERLEQLALATEITGRGRDRVFVDALAWSD